MALSALALFFEMPVETNALLGRELLGADEEVTRTMDCFFPFETMFRPPARTGRRPEYLIEFLPVKLPGSADRTAAEPGLVRKNE